MTRANQVGVGLSMLVAALWALVPTLSWPAWPAILASVAVGWYWAFGRSFVSPPE